jgi:hypothetical protein
VSKSQSWGCNHIRACQNHNACRNCTRACQNHTLRVEVTHVRVEEKVVSVVITFVRVKTSMRAESTLCVYKSYSSVSLTHAWVSYSDAYMSKLLSCQWIPHSECKITLCVWKSYSAYGNHTLRVKTNLVRVEITLVRVEITLCVYKSHLLVSKLHSCVWKSHSARRNWTLRLEITLVRIESHSCALKSHSCMFFFKFLRGGG